MDWNNMLSMSLKSLGLALLVYLLGAFGFSFSWIIIGICIWMFGENLKQERNQFFDTRKAFAVDEKREILKIEDLPAWISFPDVEKVAWLNTMIRKMWPYVGDYVKDTIRDKVEPQLKIQIEKLTKFGSFKFEKIDLGDMPVNIGGIKVYTETQSRHEIIMDLDLYYTGDCYFQVSLSKLKAGIKDIRFQGVLRVVMKPLTKKIPIVGALQVFFLQNPTIDFNLTEIANLLDFPGLGDMLRKVVKDVVKGLMVLPNKFPLKLISDIPNLMLNFPEPRGVLRVKVIEAKNLMKMDLAFLGKADPYAVVTVGNEEFRTKTITNTVNPLWNFACEALVFDIKGLSVLVEVQDKDDSNKDDEMGCTSLDIESIVAKGSVDNWFRLDNAKTGQVHVEAQWFNLSSDLLQLQDFNSSECKSRGCSTCVLIVYVDSAKDLPNSIKSGGEPSTLVRCCVGNNKQETSICNNTNSPVWEKGFCFLIDDLEISELSLEVVDKSELVLGKFTYGLERLTRENNLEEKRFFALKECSHNSQIQLCLKLLVMVPGKSIDIMPSSELVPNTGIPNERPLASDIKPPISDNYTSNINQPTSVIEPPITVISQLEVANEPDETGLRRRQINQANEGTKCSINLTMRHSKQTQVLIVVVHKVINLPCPNPSDPPDPYVKLQLIPEPRDGRRKTSVIKNCCNPIFDETFEFPISWSDLSKYSLMLTICVKASSGFFAKKKRLGKVNIALSEYELSSALTTWFDIDVSIWEDD